MTGIALPPVKGDVRPPVLLHKLRLCFTGVDVAPDREQRGKPLWLSGKQRSLESKQPILCGFYVARGEGGQKASVQQELTILESEPQKYKLPKKWKQPKISDVLKNQDDPKNKDDPKNEDFKDEDD